MNRRWRALVAAVGITAAGIGLGLVAPFSAGAQAAAPVKLPGAGTHHEEFDADLALRVVEPGGDCLPIGSPTPAGRQPGRSRCHWSQEAHHDLAATTRSPAPMTELFSLQNEFAVRFAAEPDTRTLHIRTV